MQTYTNDMRYADFPLGGIGTGTVTLTAAGELKDFQIFGEPDIGRHIPYTFFALYGKGKNGEFARVAMAEPEPDLYRPEGFHPRYVRGLPRFQSSRMTVRYPFADIAFRDDRLPVALSLTAFNPLIPGKADDSGIPGIVFRYDVKNTGEDELEILLALSMGNAHDALRSDEWDNPVASSDTYSEEKRDSKAAGVFFSAQNDAPDALTRAENAIMTPEKDAEIKKAWYRGPWYDPIVDFWEAFRHGSLEKRHDGHEKGEKEEALSVGTVGVRRKVAPGETACITFVMSWYVPNRHYGWEKTGDKTEKLRYAALYGGAWEAGRDLLRRLPALEEESRKFSRSLYASTLPESVLDAVTANIAVLRSTTCRRLYDGSFHAWEGSHRTSGSCPGTCTHVWNYAVTVAYLFPELEKSVRRNEFMNETDGSGFMAFRAHHRWGAKPFEQDAAADGQLGTIMRAYREYRITGDGEFLREVYPRVKLAFDYCRRQFDPDRDGVPEARQNNTYDVQFFGANPLTAVMMLGAAKAVAAMARVMRDDARAAEAEEIYRRGCEGIEKKLWNGEYYVQEDAGSDAPYQAGKGCLSDQLFGQTMAYMCGLGRLLPEERVRQAIRSVYKYNFLGGDERDACVQRVYIAPDEKGLVLCSWPDGGKPRFAFPYCDEVWTGIEYQVATLLAIEGETDAAEDIVTHVRSRFDGRRRAPFNENECGFYYTRAMASWGLLLAYSGFTVDAARGMIGFQPAGGKDGQWFWSAGNAWGMFRKEKGKCALSLLGGSFRMHEFLPPRGSGIARAAVNGKETEVKVKEDGKVDVGEVRLTRGDEIVFTAC